MSPNSDSILSQELSRRTALKALFGAASAAVLFGLPARAHAAEATKETTDKLNAAQAQLDEVQAEVRWLTDLLKNQNMIIAMALQNVQHGKPELAHRRLASWVERHPEQYSPLRDAAADTSDRKEQGT